jgi:peptide-methionine (R)-S-oxide reductase
MAKIEKTDAEWKGELSSEAYRVTRHHATERPYTSSLNSEARNGVFVCVCCGKDLFTSAAKFESGTGWPSFFEPTDNASLGSKTDGAFFMKRTEVHCADCEAHLGHVFPDGPQPTGLRYCINGVALTFKPVA